MFDGVLVYDGDDEWSPMLGYFCGQCLPVDIMSSGSRMLVQFSTDYSITYTGFVAQYAFVDDSDIGRYRE